MCTCLLLEKQADKPNFRAFGNEADYKFQHVGDDEEEDKYKQTLAFRHFKMSLFGNDTRTTVEDQNGVELPVVDVIAHSLKVFIFV